MAVIDVYVTNHFLTALSSLSPDFGSATTFASQGYVERFNVLDGLLNARSPPRLEKSMPFSPHPL